MAIPDGRSHESRGELKSSNSTPRSLISEARLPHTRTTNPAILVLLGNSTPRANTLAVPEGNIINYDHLYCLALLQTDWNQKTPDAQIYSQRHGYLPTPEKFHTLKCYGTAPPSAQTISSFTRPNMAVSGQQFTVHYQQYGF